MVVKHLECGQRDWITEFLNLFNINKFKQPYVVSGYSIRKCSSVFHVAHCRSSWYSRQSVGGSPKYVAVIFIRICLHFPPSLDFIRRYFIHVGLPALRCIRHWAIWTSMRIGRGGPAMTPRQPGIRADPLGIGSTPQSDTPPISSPHGPGDSGSESGGQWQVSKFEKEKEKSVLQLASFKFKLSHSQK